MNELALEGRSTSFAIVVVNATLAAMQTHLDRPVQEAAWPAQKPAYVASPNTPTFSFFDAALAAASTTASTEFARNIAAVFASLSEGQEPLGAEFEAAWDSNADVLYQS